MYKIGNVEKITWDIRDFLLLPWKRKPFNDEEQMARWREMGFTHDNFAGELIDASKPGLLPTWCWELAYKEFDYEKETLGVSMFCMKPGDIIPEHQDTYAKYRQIHNIEDPSVIWRSLVMLDDWDSGHYLEIDGVPEVNWRAGNTFTWNNDAPHIAANLGTTPRYTLQITGVKRG